MKIAIVGAGFSGAVIADQISQFVTSIDVFESRNHIAGNCHTERDPVTNVMLHVYGPHIFHTSDKEVWDYVNTFDQLMPFTNRVKAHTNGSVYSLPINLLTINSFFKKQFNPTEAFDYLKNIARPIKDPQNFEEQALSMIGSDLYEAFFKTYTMKQWGVDPKELPASILKRLPVRFSYDDNYYNSSYQGMPKNGYTYIIEKMFDKKNVSIYLNKRFDKDLSDNYDYVFYSGTLDGYFNNVFGQLKYRTLDFVNETHDGDFQGNAVINYCDATHPWTRISEHKHFSPWEQHKLTTISREYSRLSKDTDTPYYPIRLSDDLAVLEQYESLAKTLDKIKFVGRLGTYRYLDMHVTIREAIDVAREFIAHKVG